MKQTKWKKIVLFILTACLLVSAASLLGCNENKTPDKVTVTFMNGASMLYKAEGKPGDAWDKVDPNTLTVPANPGYEFGGWATNDGKAFTDTTFPKQDTTVYAQFNPIEYTIEFNAGKGQGAPVTVTATYDKALTTPDSAKNFKRTGYTLAGWATSATADAADYRLEDSFRNLTTVKGEKVTLYAYYQLNASTNGFVIENGTILAYSGQSSSLTLPEDCTAIADYAFSNNIYLKEVVIPDSYTSIGFGAFEKCTSLEKLTVPFIGGGDEETAYLAYIFGAATYSDNTYTYRFTNVDSNPTIDPNSINGTFIIPQSLRVVTITTPIDEIPEGAFYYAYGLEKVVAYRFTDDEVITGESLFSYRITKVGKSAFEGCHRLGYDSQAGVEYYMSWLTGVEEIGDSAFKGYITENASGFFANSLSTVGTLHKIKKIGNNAFQYNSGLNELTFGEELESIGESAFECCNFLQRVIIPDSCTSIGKRAFYQSAYMASVQLGKGVATIGEEAFGASRLLTEVFFANDTLPTIGTNAFSGLEERGDSLYVKPEGNDGLVFYFPSATGVSAGNELKNTYSSADVQVAGEERGPFYSASSNGLGDFMLTFSAGHTMIIEDPCYRAGFGFPVVVGTYTRMSDGVLYGDEIYTMKILGNYDFLVKVEVTSAYSSAYYYHYKIDTFTIEETSESAANFTVGKMSDEWCMVENKYGQTALYHNGTLVEKENDAAYVMGGVTQYYGDGSLRGLTYRQVDVFNNVIEGSERIFVYVPDPEEPDGNNTYYGTLYKVDDLDILFGTYLSASSDANISVSVDAYTESVTLMQGETTLYDGKYTVKSSTPNESITISAGTYEIAFTDYLIDAADANAIHDAYARCSVSVSGKTHTLYWSRYTRSFRNYYINNGTLDNSDYYILIQYRYNDENGDAAYQGYGEHYYGENGHDLLSFTYIDEKFNFTVEGSNVTYIGTVTDTDFGTFTAPAQGSATGTRTYAPNYEAESGTFTNGIVSITLSGYGTATYKAANGTEVQGTYTIASTEGVVEVFMSRTSYYRLLEYVFHPSNGGEDIYFVPNFYDSYDNQYKAGDLLLPDASRGNMYRIFDRQTGICTGVFTSNGYGSGMFYLMISQTSDGIRYTPMDYYLRFPAGITMAYYEQYANVDGTAVYRLSNTMGQGFFSFTFGTNGNIFSKNPAIDVAEDPSYEMIIGEEYEDWWQDYAAVLITGETAPTIDTLEPMHCEEEVGDYTTPDGYVLHLDGDGNATLKKDGVLVAGHENATYKGGVLLYQGLTMYEFSYTVGDMTYKGWIDIEVHVIWLDGKPSDSDPNAENVTYTPLTVNGKPLYVFSQDAPTTYTASAESDDIGEVLVYGESGYVVRHWVENGTDKYDWGICEEKDGKHVCTFDDGEYTLTLSNNSYTVDSKPSPPQAA